MAGLSTAVPSQYRNLATAASKRSGVPLPVVAAQIDDESGWRPDAISSTGAEGIAQFEPGTWSDWGTGSPYNPADAFPAYGKYMGSLLNEFSGSLRDALAAYNAGPGNLQAGYGYADTILSAAGLGDGAKGNGGSGNSGGSGGGGGFLGLGGIGSALGSIATSVGDAEQAVEWFLVPSHWVRIFSGLAGTVSLTWGLWSISRTGRAYSATVPVAGQVPVPEGGQIAPALGIGAVTIGAILLFVAFHNLPGDVNSFGSFVAYLQQQVQQQGGSSVNAAA